MGRAAIRLSFSLAVSLNLLSCGPGQQEQSNGRSGYVDNVILFDSFKMTKDLQIGIIAFQDSARHVLDSIGGIVNRDQKMIELLGDISESEEKAMIMRRSELVELQKALEAENERRIDLMRTRTWDTLNHYVKRFGQEGNYMVIHGANGSGSIMYADSTIDLTKEILEYCNELYAKRTK